MLKSRVLSICLGVVALMSMGAVSAVARDAPGNEFSLSEEWKNQILADLEHSAICPVPEFAAGLVL